jgi:hypothetical protein
VGGATTPEAPVSGRIVVAVAAVAAGALAVVAAVSLPLRTGDAEGAPAPPISVRAAFTPAAVEFGDTVTGRIVVTLDPRAVRPSSLRVVQTLAPLTQLGPVVERRATRGGTTTVTHAVRGACLTAACLASSGRRSVAPAAVRADVERRGGGRVSARARWAPLAVGGRVTPADVGAARPPFRGETTPPPVSYRIAPGTLAGLLAAAAAILAAGAAALAATAVLRARRPRAHEHPDEIGRALLLARAARTRPERDRRAAAGYIARLLARRDAPLARGADDLAWSRPSPTPDSLLELVEDVERERTP